MVTGARVLAALAVSSTLSMGQAVSIGLRTGIPITPALTGEGDRHASAQRYTIGPAIEVHLWHGAAAAADFLLQGCTLAHTEIRRWEAPLTLLYRFHSRTQPFVRTGLSFNRIFDIGGVTVCARGPFGEEFYCINGNTLAELRHRGTHGVVLGGGIQWKFKRLRLQPELRMTHWMDRNFGVRDSAVRSNLNQIGWLLGVIF